MGEVVGGAVTSGPGSPRQQEAPRIVGHGAGGWAGAMSDGVGESDGTLLGDVGRGGARGERGLVGPGRAHVVGREVGRGTGSDEVDAGAVAADVSAVAGGLGAGRGEAVWRGGRLRASRGEGSGGPWWGRWGKGRGRRKVRNWQTSIENAVADHRGNRDRYLATALTS